MYATAVTSPDGKRIAVVTHNRTVLEVGPAAGGHRGTIYDSSPDEITTEVFWASPSLIVFGDTEFSVNAIDVRTRRVRNIVGGAEDFNISPYKRWIAWSQPGHAGPGTVGIVSVNGDYNCRSLPGPANRQDDSAFFKPGADRFFFTRSYYNPETGDSGGPGRVVSVPISSLCYRP